MELGLGLGYVKLKTPVRCLRRDVRQAIGYVSLKSRGECRIHEHLPLSHGTKLST